MSYPLAYSPGVGLDLSAFDEEMRQEAATVIRRIKNGAMMGSALPTLGDSVLAGTRQIPFRTPSGRAQGRGPGCLIFQLRPGRDAFQQPTLLVIAAAQDIQPGSAFQALRNTATNRLNPGGGSLSLAFSPGVNADTDRLREPESVRQAAWQTIRGLTQVGTDGDVFDKEDLYVTAGGDLRGYREARFNGPEPASGGAAPPEFTTIYRVLPPPVGSKISTVHVVAIAEVSADTYRNAVGRLGRLGPTTGQVPQAAQPQQGRANAPVSRVRQQGPAGTDQQHHHQHQEVPHGTAPRP